MKRKITFIALLIMAIIITFSLAGCFIDSDEDIAKKNIEMLLNALDNDDKEGVKKMFSPNIIAGINNFEECIDELLSYYEGDYLEYKNGGLGTTNDNDYGKTTKYHDMSYDVTTAKGIYRLGIIWYISDSNVCDNVGIWSLYILKFEDDSSPDYSYRSEGVAGIHVAVPRPSFNV